MALSGVSLCPLCMSCLCPFHATLLTPFYVLFFPFPCPQACQLCRSLLCPFIDTPCATCVHAPLGHCCTLCPLAPALHAPLQAPILSPHTPCSP